MAKNDVVNREEFRIYQDININLNVISDIMKELVPISNKKEFYIKCVIKRIQKCDELYLKELDEELDKVYNMLNNDDFNLRDITRLMKLSARLTNEIQNLCLDNLRRICT